MYIYRGRVAWPPAYPRAYFFSKALSRLLTEKKNWHNFCKAFKKSQATFIPVSAIFQYFPKWNQSFGNFPKGLTISPAV